MKIKLLVLSIASSGVFASGYNLGVQSISNQATSNASAAEVADASTIFYNPAGMSYLQENNFTAIASLLSPSMKYKDAQAYTAGGKTVSGKPQGKITKDLTIAPHAYGTYRINDRFTLGMGLFVPYGSETTYSDDSIMRYETQKTAVKAITLQPSLSFKLNEQHSFGLGIMAQRLDAELRKHVDLVSAVAAGMGNQGAILAGAIGQPNTDTLLDVSGAKWGIGFNLGWMWQPTEKARIGLSYRSAVKHKIDGKATWQLTSVDSLGLPAPVTNLLAPAFNNLSAVFPASEGVSVTITTPEVVSLHGIYNIDQKWNLFGDLSWTRHSRLQSLDLQFDKPKPGPNNTVSDTQSIIAKWRDTFKIALGTSYQMNDKLQLRTGIAYDQSPTKNAEYRLATLPDNDRVWLSFGSKYDITKKSSINLAYSYVFIKNSEIDRKSAKAKYKANAQYLGLQYNLKF